MKCAALLAASVLALLAASPATAFAQRERCEEFAPGVREASSRLVSAGKSVGRAVTNAYRRTDEELAVQFEALSERTASIADDIDALQAPTRNLAKRTDTLEGRVRAAAYDLEAISGAAEQHDPAAARQATLELARDSARIRRARVALLDRTKRYC